MCRGIGHAEPAQLPNVESVACFVAIYCLYNLLIQGVTFSGYG